MVDEMGGNFMIKDKQLSLAIILYNGHSTEGLLDMLRAEWLLT